MTATLLRASIDGAILVALVWMATRVFRGLGPGMRTLLWWCAAAKFVLALVWVSPIAVPILPAAKDAAPSTSVRPAGAASTVSGSLTVASAARQPEPAGGALTWRELLVGAWAAGTVAASIVWLRRWRRTRRIIENARTAPDEVCAMARDLASRLALARTPRVLLSSDVQTPLVAGILSPAVLVPDTSFGALPIEQREMALCHELAHLKRGDLWLGCVPALAERLFFFHPLAHLAAREYCLWREAACDATVIATLGTSPRDYGRLLLELGIARPQAGLAAAGAPWSLSHLKRRISMLREPSVRPLTARLVMAGLAALAAVALVPLEITARSPHPVTVIDSGPPSPVAVAQPVEPPDPPAPAVPPAQDRDDRRGSKDHLNYVLLQADGKSTMSGSSRDVERARRHQRDGERILWFRHDGREFIVRNDAAIEEVEGIWTAVGELGRKMGDVGARQGAIGARQGEIGARQGEVGAKQGMIGARQGMIGAQQATLAARMVTMSDAQRSELEKQSADLERQMRELGDQMAKLGRQMEELNRPMDDLGQDMEVLGREMEALGKEMDVEVKKAEQAMRALLERAVASGLAEGVK